MAVTPKPVKRIGILTGGGDCPGLNAVIRAVTKAAILKLGIDVVGIEDGFLGLIENRMHELNLGNVSNILTVGGTILGTSNKANPERFPVGKDSQGKNIYGDVRDQIVDNVRARGIDLLVCIGGDGTMSGSLGLIEKGIPCVGVPKTIDNDLMYSDITFGFVTAVQTATECLDRIHTTGASHHRVMVVELMGRNAGWLTMSSGLASGADVILIPEIPYDIESVAQTCVERSKRHKRFTLVAVSEGARPVGGKQTVGRMVEESADPVRLGGIGNVLANQITDCCGLESRATVLGHVQRGGTPVAYDRVLASQFGHAAISMVALFEWNKVAVMRGGTVDMVPIAEVANKQRLMEVDDPYIALARSLGVSMGD